MKAPTKRLCPKCDRVLYNRRLDRCGYCAAPVPEELRFSAEEIAEVNRMESELELNRKIQDAIEWARLQTPSQAPPGLFL